MKNLLLILMFQMFVTSAYGQSSSVSVKDEREPQAVSEPSKDDDDAASDDDESYAKSELYENKAVTLDYETQKIAKYHEHVIRFMDKIGH